MAPRQQGFTILEVLVAFLVAALLLTTILSGFASGMTGLFRADRYSVAALVAQSRMAEVGITEALKPGSYQGRDSADPDYSWRVEVSPLDWDYAGRFAEMGGTLYRVKVSVFWQGGGRDNVFALTSLRGAVEAVAP
ncbi:MAG: prepilin-type N-terminal cleavage/methylation domain-containing protein [Pseudomonadota bacterium]